METAILFFAFVYYKAGLGKTFQDACDFVKTRNSNNLYYNKLFTRVTHTIDDNINSSDDFNIDIDEDIIKKCIDSDDNNYNINHGDNNYNMCINCKNLAEKDVYCESCLATYMLIQHMEMEDILLCRYCRKNRVDIPGMCKKCKISQLLY